MEENIVEAKEAEEPGKKPPKKGPRKVVRSGRVVLVAETYLVVEVNGDNEKVNYTGSKKYEIGDVYRF